jgi:hypothetical protein
MYCPEFLKVEKAGKEGARKRLWKGTGVCVCVCVYVLCMCANACVHMYESGDDQGKEDVQTTKGIY